MLPCFRHTVLANCLALGLLLSALHPSLAHAACADAESGVTGPLAFSYEVVKMMRGAMDEEAGVSRSDERETGPETLSLSDPGADGLIEVTYRRGSTPELRALLTSKPVLDYHKPHLPAAKELERHWHTGYGSYYGDEFAGKLNSCGKPYVPSHPSVANAVLPKNTLVEFKFGDHTRRFRVEDGGPYANSTAGPNAGRPRLFDFSTGARKLLGYETDEPFQYRIVQLGDGCTPEARKPERAPASPGKKKH